MDGVSRPAFATLLMLISTPGFSQEWKFHVTADGFSIGTHTFKVTGDADNRKVKTSAIFVGKVLLIPIYHYEHHDEEAWKDGCLQHIDADTNDNGTTHPVHGHADSQGLHLGSGRMLPGCIQTFAYWDKRFLQQSHLLNSQTGEYTPITTNRLGDEKITVLKQSMDAEHYQLKTPRFSIDLWYSKTGEWLALESLTENGHHLKYEQQ
jgi:hypothetical protein